MLRQHRSTQRRARLVPDDEAVLTSRIVALASEYGRYGYRRVTALLRREGWRVNHKRVERIWRQEGLKVPKRQPKRGRMWLNALAHDRPRANQPHPAVKIIRVFREAGRQPADHAFNHRHLLFGRHGFAPYYTFYAGAKVARHAAEVQAQVPRQDG